ncbi:hypothetical protein RFI_32151, partial [Reticulomyxa filosa]
CCHYGREIVKLAQVNENEEWCRSDFYKFDPLPSLEHTLTALKEQQQEWGELNVKKGQDGTPKKESNSETSLSTQVEAPLLPQFIASRVLFITVLLELISTVHRCCTYSLSSDHTHAPHAESSYHTSHCSDDDHEHHDHSHNDDHCNHDHGDHSHHHHHHQHHHHHHEHDEHDEHDQKSDANKKKAKKSNKKNKGTSSQQSEKATAHNKNTHHHAHEKESAVLTQDKQQQFMLQEMSRLCKALVTVVNQKIKQSIHYGHSNPLGFDSRIIPSKLTIRTLPRRQIIPPRIACFEHWCHFVQALNFACDIVVAKTLDECLELLKHLSCNFGSVNVVVRAFLFIFLDVQIQTDNMLWTHKPMTDLIKQSFHRQCDWARMFTTDSQKIQQWTLFFSRVQSGVRDLIGTFLVDPTQQPHYYMQCLRNWAILERASIDMDEHNVSGYIELYDTKYHTILETNEQYQPHKNAYTVWIIRMAIDSMIQCIFIRLTPLQLFAAHELKFAYFYLEYLYRNQMKVLQHSIRPFKEANAKELHPLLPPKLQKTKPKMFRSKFFASLWSHFFLFVIVVDYSTERRPTTTAECLEFVLSVAFRDLASAIFQIIVVMFVFILG